MNKTQKYIILIASLLIAILAYFVAIHCLYSDLSAWQLSQNVSFEDNTGSTKFAAQINSITIGGLGFIVTAILFLIKFKISKKKIEKELEEKK